MDLSKISDREIFDETKRRDQMWINWSGNLYMNTSKLLRLTKHRDLVRVKREFIRAEKEVEMTEQLIKELELILNSLPDPESLKPEDSK